VALSVIHVVSVQLVRWCKCGTEFTFDVVSVQVVR